TGFDVVGQVGIRDAHAGRSTGTRRHRRVEEEVVAVTQRRLALRETLDANLGTLQVAHDPDDLLAGIGGLPQSRNACALVLFRAVREVDACYIEAGADHLLES